MLASDPPAAPASPGALDGARPPTPAAEIEELRSMLEQFRNAPFFFEAMKQDYLEKFAPDDGLPEEERAVREMLLEEPRNVAVQLGYQKELFSKLKGSWLHHETLEKFLRRILDLNPQFSTSAEVAELEARVEGHKKQLRSKKRAADGLKAEVADLADRVVEGHGRLAAELEAVEETLAKIDNAEQALVDHEKVMEDERATNDATIADARALLAELTSVSDAIKSEADEWRAKIAAIEADNDRLNGEIADLKGARDRAFAEVDEAERIAMRKDLRLEEYGEWLKAQQPLLNNLLGVESTTVLPPSDLEIRFRPLPPNDDGTIFTLRVLVNEHSADRVVDVEVAGCPEGYDDILDRANEHVCAASTVVRGRRLEERLPLCVRDVIRRTRGWHAKGKELASLRASGRYDIAELDLRRVAVTFRNGSQFLLSTDADYPRGPGMIDLVEVRKADGKMDLPMLKELKGKMAELKIETITQALAELGLSR
ncbi:hypothetical protein DFJ74DRAFT_700728 [Hyaloraphidium curvatum]|nr:hypothetical protein DFJ74DRAFT_700728 [Hyaloraphidium curvatum]